MARRGHVDQPGGFCFATADQVEARLLAQRPWLGRPFLYLGAGEDDPPGNPKGACWTRDGAGDSGWPSAGVTAVGGDSVLRALVPDPDCASTATPTFDHVTLRSGR